MLFQKFRYKDLMRAYIIYLNHKICRLRIWYLTVDVWMVISRAKLGPQYSPQGMLSPPGRVYARQSQSDSTSERIS